MFVLNGGKETWSLVPERILPRQQLQAYAWFSPEIKNPQEASSHEVPVRFYSSFLSFHCNPHL